MSRRVTAVAPETPLEDLARTLAATRYGGVPVVDAEQRVIGFVSETDVVAALLNDAAPDTKARDIMSHPPIVIDEFAPADEVMSVLRESDIRHLPVVREERLVGIITPNDVVRFFVRWVLPQPPEAG
jgi:CBS domain-containing protein